jgi:hypothetical protein
MGSGLTQCGKPTGHLFDHLIGACGAKLIGTLRLSAFRFGLDASWSLGAFDPQVTIISARRSLP